jgi:uncharacterized SAM-dependent methyltransferase
MLQLDRTSYRSPTLATELRDALGRRQKELPARWLAACEASSWHMTSDTTGPATPGSPSGTEEALGLAVLERHLAQVRPRGVVFVHASASPASARLLDAVRRQAPLTAGVAIEWDLTLARVVASALEGSEREDADDRFVVAAVVADCSVDLPLPAGFPLPRIYFCLGNALGTVTAVAAIRILRVLRATMSPGDVIVLGLACAGTMDASTARDELADPARHVRALKLIDGVFGSSLGIERFACESRFDAANRRAETHLVACRAIEVEIPGVGCVRLRKGESIRTAVNCTFDRSRATAMLAGVGLALLGWEPDASGRVAVAAAGPATC